MAAPLTRNKFLAVTSIVTAISLAGSFVNFVAQAVLAFRFGASSAVDAYTYALSLPLFLSGLIGIIISYAAVPMMARSSTQAGRGTHIGNALSFLLLRAALLFAVAGLTAGWWQTLILPAADPLVRFAGLKILISLAWIVGAVQILVALAAAQLNAAGRPIIAALLGLPTNCVTIIVLLFATSGDIAVAIAGMAFGAGVSALIGFWFAREQLLPPRAITWASDGTARRITVSALWASLALSCFASYAVVDAIWASRVGEGALASMGYAHRIIIGLGSLVVAGPSALFVPQFAVLVEGGQGTQFRRLLLAALGFTAAVGGVLAAGLYVFADLIVQILFERGAFGASASAMVADVLRHMAPGMVAMLFSVITLRALFCLPKSERAAAAMGVGFTCSYAFFSYVLLAKGIIGIAMAYSISWIGFFAMLFSYVIWRSGRLEK
jgi:putative peptidoglycan lipid II flippase